VVRRAAAKLPRVVRVHKGADEALGIEVSSAVFDRVQTCDNHCDFCFIYQLPKGMRRSLYLKDDDYRLSFLYGNFTTLTRFTELDAERVLTERLSPLFVSIHATDPEVRAGMLRNPKGAISLRWLRVLLDGGIEVHGQIVVCPGINDAAVLEDTLTGVLDEYPDLATVGVVPLGLSRFSREPGLRPHTLEEAGAICDAVAEWQQVFLSVLGRRFVYAADEYYLLANRPFPGAEEYEGFPQHENGIGMARAFESAFHGTQVAAGGVRPGFFAWVDGAPPEGYRAPRMPEPATAADRTGRGGLEAGSRGQLCVAPFAPQDHPLTIVTGSYGGRVLVPLLEEHPRADVRVLVIENDFFGGNIGVAGLLTGGDLARALSRQPEDRLYLIPDACVHDGRFLDGLTPGDLPRTVRVVPSDGGSLLAALAGEPAGARGSR
jgi:NifB/MoaA-like Fe-S oxidoreductase